MPVTKPEINDLLDRTEQNPFLLCSIASKRARDINTMLRGQHLRVLARQDMDDITTQISGKDPVTIAMTEIEQGLVGYVHEQESPVAGALDTVVDAPLMDEAESTSDSE